MIIESLYADREVEITFHAQGRPRLRIANTVAGFDEIAYLTPQGAYRLMEALQPFAEKPKSVQEQFEDLEIGAHFNLTEDGAERVKISKNHYVFLGDPIVFRPFHLSDEADITEVKK